VTTPDLQAALETLRENVRHIARGCLSSSSHQPAPYVADIDAALALIEQRIGELERERCDCPPFERRYWKPRAERAEARIAELERALRRIADPTELTGDGPLEPLLADPHGTGERELRARMRIALAAFDGKEEVTVPRLTIRPPGLAPPEPTAVAIDPSAPGGPLDRIASALERIADALVALDGKEEE